MSDYDPHGKVDSLAVTEARTVLSRARTALEALEVGDGLAMVVVPGSWDYDGKPKYTEPVTIPLPDGPELVEALRKTVALLSPWENRASRRRGNS